VTLQIAVGKSHLLDTSRDVAYKRYMQLLREQRERVGRQIRTARRQAGLSHDQLAARVGTSRQHLIKLEKGQHLPRPEMLDRIAQATNKAPSFFESDDEDEESDAMEALTRALRRVVRDELAARA
jgi:transcriptional regulator with XRE-family HTH domain